MTTFVVEWMHLRKQVLAIIAAAIVMGITTSSVAASTNQGLYWGVFEGQRFDYTRHFEYTNIHENKTIDLQFYIILDEITYIPDDLNLWTLWELDDRNNRSCYFLNGTEKTSPYSWGVIPISNWDLIIDLWKQNLYVGEEQIIDTPTLAGWNYNYSIGNMTGTWSQIYLKQNGVLQTYQLIFDGSDFQNSSELITLIPNYIGTIILSAGGISIVAIVIIALVIARPRWNRSRFEGASEKIIVTSGQE